MAYDLEEQEQLDELKAWWKRYGNLVTNLAIAALLVYAGYQGWHYYQHKQAIEASTHYQELVVSDEKDVKSIQIKSAMLMEKFSGTPYAGRAALFAAKVNYQAKDTKSAKSQLQWAIENAKESSIKAIASLQLANVLFDEKDFNGAIKVLDAKHDTGFDGLFNDLKGDALAALGKNTEAKAAYEAALTKLDSQGKYRVITQRKLESLG